MNVVAFKGWCVRKPESFQSKSNNIIAMHLWAEQAVVPAVLWTGPTCSATRAPGAGWSNRRTQTGRSPRMGLCPCQYSPGSAPLKQVPSRRSNEQNSCNSLFSIILQSMPRSSKPLCVCKCYAMCMYRGGGGALVVVCHLECSCELNYRAVISEEQDNSMLKGHWAYKLQTAIPTTSYYCLEVLSRTSNDFYTMIEYEQMARLRLTYRYMWMLVKVAAWSKAWTVFAHLNAGIVGSNPTQSMDICVRLFCVCVVLCVGNGFAMVWSPIQESYQLCIY
jgi:hypothetical protein